MNKKFLTKYDHAISNTSCDGVSMTDQQYRDECDIDMILKRYRAGQPLPVNTRQGRFGDFSEVGDFESCLRRVNNAISDFTALPAVVRARFGNDPVAFYHFALDGNNLKELASLGIESAPVKAAKNAAPSATQATPADGSVSPSGSTIST